jgi:hypothetical protein
MTYQLTPTRWRCAAWPQIFNLIRGVDAHVAGGYATWHMCEEFGDDGWSPTTRTPDHTAVTFDRDAGMLLPAKRPGDIDIFTYKQSTYDYLHTRLSGLGFMPLKESQYCTTWQGDPKRKHWGDAGNSHMRYAMEANNLRDADVRRDPLGDKKRPSTLNIPIQLIKPVFGDSLVKVLDHFDFYMAKFALIDEKTVLAHPKAVESLTSKQLTPAHPDQLIYSPFYVLSRYIKYIQKGYKLNYLQLYQIITTAQAEGIRNSDMTDEEVKELVVEFGQYLHNGSNLGPHGEDFRPTMEEAYGAWLNYLLRNKS